jgi:hypothetical protein
MKHFGWLFVLLFTVSIINYPNPFNPKGGEIATFECSSDSSLEAALYIYDMSARLLLRKLFPLRGGTVNRTGWDGFSDSNERVGNGVYLYRLVDTSTKKSVGKGKVWVINR